MSFVAFTVGCIASSACMWELSLALDEYSASASSRRYRGVLEAPKGPSALNWSVSAKWVKKGSGSISYETWIGRFDQWNGNTKAGDPGLVITFTHTHTHDG